MDSSGDCSYTTNGASLPQAQMTSADRRAAEAKAAETLQISYINNLRNSKQAMLKTVHMAGKQYGGVNTLLHTLLQTLTSMLLHRTTKNSHTIVRIIPAQELYYKFDQTIPMSKYQTLHSRYKRK